MSDKLIVDRVQFDFPQSKELWFPAAVVLQAFVNEYEQRMRLNDAGQGYTYELHYGVNVSDETWLFLQSLGLTLKQDREELDGYDMYIDLSEERLSMYRNSGKHVCQAYAVMSGIGDLPPIPKIRVVTPLSKQQYWGIIPGEKLSIEGPLFTQVSDAQLLKLKSGELTGVIGHASWQTYLAASYGLPVIEIIPSDRPVTWLSKWANPFYRAVQVTDNDHALLTHIAAAMENIGGLLCSRPAQEAATV